MSEQFTTVVFKHERSELVKEMFAAFANNKGEFNDTVITAMSNEDEISRVEELEMEE